MQIKPVPVQLYADMLGQTNDQAPFAFGQKGLPQKSLNTVRFGQHILAPSASLFDRVSGHVLQTPFDWLRQALPGFSGKLGWFAEQITTVYLWGYVAQDVFAMWLPRVTGGLFRGARPYNPKKDPENKGLTPWQVFKKWAVQSWKGLNWDNAKEDFIREISGNGFPIIPSLGLAVTRLFLGRSAVDMGDSALKTYTHGFIEHLKSTPLGRQPLSEKLAEADYTQTLKQYIHTLFADEAFSNQALGDQVIQKRLDNLLSRWVETGRSQWDKRGFKQWLAQWTNPELRQQRQTTRQTLKSLESEIHDLVLDFNRQHRSSEFLNDMGAYYAPLLKKQVVPIQTVLNDLRNWKDLAWSVFEAHAQYGYTDTLPQLTEKLMQRVRARKVLGFVWTAVACAYLYSSAKWAQRNKTYLATRNLRFRRKKPVQALTTQPDHQVGSAQNKWGQNVPLVNLTTGREPPPFAVYGFQQQFQPQPLVSVPVMTPWAPALMPQAGFRARRELQ